MVGKTEKNFFKSTIILEPGCVIDVSTQIVVFALKPNISLVKTIIQLIQETAEEKKFLAFFCPNCTNICNEILDSGGVMKTLMIHELSYELIPVENDVLTLEDNVGFRNLMMGEDFQTLELVKETIQRLEAIYGKIPLKYAKGDWSSIIHDGLSDGKEGTNSAIDTLILIDRSVDLITPLMTQMTYEGMLDEILGIKCGIAEVDEKIVNPEAKDGLPKRTLLLRTDDDIFYGQSRDLHFNMMKGHFSKKYQEMKNEIENSEKAKSLTQMTEYVAKLRNFKIPQIQANFNTSTYSQ